MRHDLRIASTGDVTLQLYDLGGDGPPLLICHATSFCGRAYEPLAVALSDRFHVHALDFRGHGRSDPSPGGDYGWSRMAEDVIASVRAISADGVYAIGHSMGGAAALLAEVAAPGTLRAAYIYEPALVPPDVDLPDAAPILEMTRRRKSVFASRAEAKARLLAVPTFARWREDCLDAFLEHGLADRADGSVVLRCAPDTEAACYSSGAAAVATVLEVRMPLAVAVGMAADFFGAAATVRALAAGLPEAQLIEHPTLSHFGPLENPAEVAAAARGALSD